MPSVSASDAALPAGRTLKPTMIALEATARLTSPSVMPPTAAWTMVTFTFCVESLASAWLDGLDRALHVALDDQLELELIGLLEPVGEGLERDARVLRDERLRRLLPARLGDLLGGARVLDGVHADRRRSGTSFRPSTSTGVDGPASRTARPSSSVIARTLPHAAPARRMSPACRVPSCTMTRATGPRPRSRSASITVPLARFFGLALSSSTSAWRSTASSSSSMPCARLGRDVRRTSCRRPTPRAGGRARRGRA